MRNKLVLFFSLMVVAIATVAVTAQDDAKKETLDKALGVVKSVGAQKIVLQVNTQTLDAVLVSNTQYLRLSPDNLKLSAAMESKLSEISNGDRVLITGTYSDDKKSMFVSKVFLVKGSDIAEQQEKQRQEWRTRGISGQVTEVDAAAKTITVKMRSITGQETTLKISPKNEVKYLRYSPDSVKYSDAIESDFSTIQKDDMIQALGDKSEDGTTLTAEEILTGAFVTVAGPVKSVDAEKNQVTINDLKTKKDVTITVKNNSLLKKFPEEIAQRMARFQAMMQAGGGGVRPPNAGRGQGRRGGDGEGRGGGRGRMDINEMLNRFPTISVADLKAGEMIAVSSPKGADETQLTAIKLLAGVEPFIRMSASGGSGRSGGGGGRGGVSGGINIPGLDGADF